MAYNLSRFKAMGVPQGGARPSQFDITLTFPTPLAATLAQEKFTFQAQGSDLPPSTIGTIPVSYFGRQIKVNGERQYPNWRVQIINDEDMAVRAALERWHVAINSVVDNVMDPAISNVSGTNALGSSYKTVATISQYRKTGTPGTSNNNDMDIIRSYQMDGIFPVDIGEIRVGWERVNEIEMYTVEFAYDWWIPIVGTGSRTTEAGASLQGITTA